MYKEILAIDPGKHMGFARFVDGLQVEIGTIDGEEDIWKWIGKQRPDCWVVEDYRIRDERAGGFDHIFQSVFPAQVIGAIKFFAYNLGTPVFLQQPQIKYSASPMLFSKPYKKQGGKHWLDAVLHGGYFIKTQK